MNVAFGSQLYGGSPAVVEQQLAPSGGSGPATSATLTLTTGAGVPLPGLSGLKWAFFDAATPDLFAAPAAKGAVESTDGSGVLVLDITGTTLIPGQTGWVIVTDSDGSVSNHRAFSGPVQVA